MATPSFKNELWAYARVTGATGALVLGTNIASVVRTGVGTYDITLGDELRLGTTPGRQQHQW